MDFKGNGYKEKKEFTLVTNGKKVEDAKNSYMKIARDVIFAHMVSEPNVQKYSQMLAKVGIQKLGQKVVSAMIKEFTQLNERVVTGKPVVVPIDTSTITEEKRKALYAVNLIKEKRNGDVKGMCRWK